MSKTTKNSRKKENFNWTDKEIELIQKSIKISHFPVLFYLVHALRNAFRNCSAIRF